MSLKAQLDQKRQELQLPDHPCVESTSSGHAPAFIEFWPTPHERVGYSSAHLLQYHWQTLPPNGDPAAIPDVLTLSFSTADVILHGWHLDKLTALLAEARVKRVQAQAERFAGLRAEAFVARIEIKPIKAD